jgi:hypothetical protein
MKRSVGTTISWHDLPSDDALALSRIAAIKKQRQSLMWRVQAPAGHTRDQALNGNDAWLVASQSIHRSVV